MNILKDVNNFYIIFEGIDGCGKSTQLKRVRDYLVAQDIDCICLATPTRKSEYGKAVRRSFQPDNRRMGAHEELMAFLADHEWNTQRYVRPAMELDAFVLQDRGYLSTVAYQSKPGDSKEEHDANAERMLDLCETTSIKPDAFVYVDLPVDVALERIATNRGEETAMEKRDVLNRVKEAYDYIISKHGRDRNIQAIDGSLGEGEVTAVIVNFIQDLMGERRFLIDDDHAGYGWAASHYPEFNR